MNKIILTGRLTKDIELKDAGNSKVANFSLAVDRAIKQEGKPEVDFIDCAAFGKTAEFMGKYMAKGSKIALEGRLQNDTYTDKEGKKRTHAVVIANAVEFAGPKPNTDADVAADVEDETDEIPFA
jgi:single-strand DNA-binding protein